ncbi:Ribosomal protein L23 [mine drainage metagenome]|uniref:Ribosomal protein L23 n=1 Tax=mine drainage metagenome TaxID=410659 RepID=T0Z943_9ZZZZ
MSVKEVIYSPVATEKTMLMTESENKIVFLVDRDATRADVKNEVEELYKVKVESIRVMRTKKGKKAIVKLKEGFSADDLAGRIGLF